MVSTLTSLSEDHDSSAALRKKLLANKISVGTRISHEMEIVNITALNEIASLLSAVYVVKRNQQSLDLEFTVESELCENIMYSYTKEKVMVERYRKSVSENALSLVYHCVQHYLGYSGMRSITFKFHGHELGVIFSL